MVYYTIAAVEILGQVKKNALAGNPTTAVFPYHFDLRCQTGPTGSDVLFKNSPYSSCKLPAK